MKTLQQITEHLNNTDDSTLVTAWNEYQREASLDGELYDFDDDFFDTFFEGKPMEAARATHFGDVNWNDDYIKFNGYGNLETVRNPSNEIDIDELAEYINDHQQDFDYIMDEIEDEEEVEE